MVRNLNIMGANMIDYKQPHSTIKTATFVHAVLTLNEHNPPIFDRFPSSDEIIFAYFKDSGLNKGSIEEIEIKHAFVANFLGLYRSNAIKKEPLANSNSKFIFKYCNNTVDYQIKVE